MIKRLCTILLAALVAAPSMAQLSKSSDKEGVVFAPQKGQWQVSMVFGHNGFYNKNASYNLLPYYTTTGGSIGLPNGGTDMSGNLAQYLNINGFDNNSVVNIAGLQVKYFVSDCWDINLSFGMNIDITPGKDYVEGDNSVPDMVIPSQDYINAQTTNNWYVTVGTDRYCTSRRRTRAYTPMWEPPSASRWQESKRWNLIPARLFMTVSWMKMCLSRFIWLAARPVKYLA